MGGRVQLVRVPTLSQSEIICWLTPFSSSCVCNIFFFPDWLLTHAASGGFKSVVGGARQCIKTKRLPPFALEYSSVWYVWSRGSERRSSLCLPMSDSIFLSLSLLPPGKECRISRKGVSGFQGVFYKSETSGD